MGAALRDPGGALRVPGRAFNGTVLDSSGSALFVALFVALGTSG